MVTAPIADLADFAALDPFFRIIEQGLEVLEYASDGHVVGTGRRYANRYISVLTIRHRKVVALAGLPRPGRRVRCGWLAIGCDGRAPP
jgi:hypothetical protein